MHRRAAGILPVFLLTAAIAAGETQTVPLFVPANDGIRQGFTRVVNLSNRAGTVSVRARDDDGALRRTSFRIAASAVYHFNSDDLENGNAVKGITGIGNGTGDWHLALDSALPIAVTAYLRTDDGFLTAMNNTVARGPDGGLPGHDLQSRLKRNPGEHAPADQSVGADNHGNRAGH